MQDDSSTVTKLHRVNKSDAIGISGSPIMGMTNRFTGEQINFFDINSLVTDFFKPNQVSRDMKALSSIVCPNFTSALDKSPVNKPGYEKVTVGLYYVDSS